MAHKAKHRANTSGMGERIGKRTRQFANHLSAAKEKIMSTTQEIVRGRALKIGAIVMATNVLLTPELASPAASEVVTTVPDTVNRVQNNIDDLQSGREMGTTNHENDLRDAETRILEHSYPAGGNTSLHARSDALTHIISTTPGYIES